LEDGLTDLLASYRAAGPGHDEMLQSAGSARAAWEQMAELAGIDSWERLRARSEDVVTLLEDHGVTVGADPDDAPWPLDPLPVIIDEAEWVDLEARLEQRAELLDAIFTDLTTERRLLADGLLPPEIVLAHPGFLRAADGILIPGRHQLFLHATDVVRNADGAWLALGDRTQTPGGMGYVMEDRRVIGQVLSGLYRQARIRRIGPFFHAMRQALQEVGPPGSGDDPRVALLSPGARTETAFDQAYLSTMLGFPLVEGEDLVVSDGRVWMRSLDELEPVDVIVRSVDAEYCDPLELLGSSGLGVPGLVEAARTGAVTIVNPLGSGLMENPALLTYLPRLSRALLGEELALRSAVTYWCGERSMCSHVIANLDRLVISSTAPGSPPIDGWELTAGERAELAARISQTPHQWVGQEPTEASTTPTVGEGRLDARSTVLRTFAVARQEGYQVMSGALARVTSSGTRAEPLASTALGSVAKDVWILSAEAQTLAEPRQPEEPEVIPPRGAWASAISPGAAEDLFWFGRYTERTEGTVRLIRAVADRFEDYHLLPHSIGGRALQVLMDAVGQVVGPGTLTDLVLDVRLPGSVAFAVEASTRSATAVRDQLSSDTWLALSSIERALNRERVRQQLTSAEDLGLGRVLARCLEGLLALAGIGAESMVRDVGWWLMDVGRRIERGQHLVRTLRATVTRRHSTMIDSMLLESVLIAHESVITYRRRSQTHARLDLFLELLLLDHANPRSLAHQLAEIRTDLAGIPASSARVGARDQLLSDLQDLLMELDPAAVVVADDEGNRPRLLELLESLQWRLDELALEVARVHFSHPTASPWADAYGTWSQGDRDD
jgi:uncharacterized circularly permuted ATP-grasp superfamily protein/uncharacterized alpha-E superfamily protein